MALIHVEESAVIEAPAEKIYAVIIDYQKGHPAILPKQYFSELAVEQGGKGAGTVLRVRMTVFGTKRDYHIVVSEPEPGRVLAEADIDMGVATTFTVEPLDGGNRSRVTIATDFKASAGLAGMMERLVTPPVTRRIYQKELRQLADYVRSN